MLWETKSRWIRSQPGVGLRIPHLMRWTERATYPCCDPPLHLSTSANSFMHRHEMQWTERQSYPCCNPLLPLACQVRYWNCQCVKRGTICTRRRQRRHLRGRVTLRHGGNTRRRGVVQKPPMRPRRSSWPRKPRDVHRARAHGALCSNPAAPRQEPTGAEGWRLFSVSSVRR